MMKTCTDTTAGGRRKGQRGITLMELLIAMTIMTLITTMIIVSWLALSDSYSYSVRSSVARDDAREAIARMAREIRDAQSNPNGGEAALLRARPRSILITTTFNEAGNTDPASVPHLVMFRLYPDGELWRFEDRPVGGVYDGVIDNVALSIADTWPGANPYGAVESVEQTTGEGASLLCKDVVNDTVTSPGVPKALFRYSYYEPDGDLVQDTLVTTITNRSRVVAVQINLLVDLNPLHAPVYTEFQTTAQLRNQR